MWHRNMHPEGYTQCISKISHIRPPQRRVAMQEPWEAGPPWRAWLLAKMGLPTDQVPADADAFMEDAIKHLKRPNQSGYRDVFK